MQVIALCDILLEQSPSKKILILTPVNTLRQCFAEFDYWLPAQPHENFIARKFIVNKITDLEKTPEQRWKIFSQWKDGGVMLLGYEMYRSIVLPRKRPRNDEKNVEDMYHEMRSSLMSTDIVICDEGHRIKQMHSQTFQSLEKLNIKTTKIILTGYPLQNNLREFYTLTNFVLPGVLGHVNNFKILFDIPITMGQYTDSTPEAVKVMRYRRHVLQKLVDPVVHRRCEKILRDALPPKSEYTLLFKMTTLQRELYEKVREVSKNKTINAFGAVSKIMNDPNILFKYLFDDKKKNADIEDEGEESYNYYKPLQPLMKEFVPELINTSPKMIVLFRMIEDFVKLNEKITIFSQSLLTLDMIEEVLQIKLNWKRNLHFYRKQYFFFLSLLLKSNTFRLNCSLYTSPVAQITITY